MRPGLIQGTADALARGWSWWVGELAGMVPRSLTRGRDQAAASLEMSARDAVLVVAGRGGGAPLRIPLDPDDMAANRARVAPVLRSRPNLAAIIRFDDSLVLEPGVTLPLAAERSLRPILANQIERLVPLAADDVVFEHRIEARSPAAKTISVRLSVATRASIERALALARALDLAPRAVIAGAGPAMLWRATAKRGSRTERVLRHALEAVAVLLLVAAVGIYLHRLDTIRDALRDDIARATRASAAARSLATRSAGTADALAVLQKRQSEIQPLAMLDKLTELVPRTAWVTQLTMRGRNVEMIGFTRKVSSLVARIENHELFYDPKFRSPITMAADGQTERFDISFSVDAEGSP